MKKLKKEMGITLVALVVTIIVLIILAGISISLVLGDNGIVTKAKLAKENTEKAKIEEEITLNEVAENMENLEKEDIPYNKPYQINGFEHIGGTWNAGYIIREISTGNEFVWVPCVLEQEKVREGDNVVTFGKKTDGTYIAQGMELLPANTNVLEEDGSVKEIRESVGKYGGFYIARYEAGIEGEIENLALPTKTKVDGSVKPLSQAGKGVWNSITRANAIELSKKMIDSKVAKSTLISGEAWDTTLQWMVNTSDNKEDEANKGYDINGAGKGWYSDVSGNTRHTTGYYSVNNIYDMAGNVFEWTTENCIMNGGHFYSCRGGDFGGVASAATRSYTTDAYVYCGFRVVIYK